MKPSVIIAIFLTSLAVGNSLSASSAPVYSEDIPMNPITYVPVLVMLFVTLGVTISVALAMTWAGRTGQFENLKQGSESIFDDGEPIGEMTDRFPEKSAGKKQEGKNLKIA